MQDESLTSAEIWKKFADAQLLLGSCSPAFELRGRSPNPPPPSAEFPGASAEGEASIRALIKTDCKDVKKQFHLAELSVGKHADASTDANTFTHHTHHIPDQQESAV